MTVHLSFFQWEKMIEASSDCHLRHAVVCTQSTWNTLPALDWHFFCLQSLFGQTSKPLLKLLLPHHEPLPLFRPFHLNSIKGWLLHSMRQVQHVLVTGEHLYIVAGKMSLASNDWCLLCQDMPLTAKVTCYVTSKGYDFASAGHTLDHLLSAWHWMLVA